MSRQKKQIYLVVNGRQPGVYDHWFGEDGAAEEVVGYPNAVYRGFHTQAGAVEWLGQFKREDLAPQLLGFLDSAPELPADENPEALLAADQVLIYADGAALGNPGPGGYGVVLRYKQYRRELSGGYQQTTNNRMELMACIRGLEALKSESSVTVFSDSSYVVNAMTKGWAQRWRTNGWRRDGGQPVKNADLWRQLLPLCDQHAVEFRWVRGHAGHTDNERCDQLAVAAARGRQLSVDQGYKNNR
jgi:ribonuclease HI